jgi:RHS repeat-associated protein
MGTLRDLYAESELYGELERDASDPPDMQARSYRPDIGRFLSADRYQDAQADLELQSDPLTQNRYAFAGGNPVSNIEFDGHHDLPIIGHGTKGVTKALQHRNCHAAASCGGRMFRDNRGRALPKRQIRALRKLDRATPGNLTTALRPAETRRSTGTPSGAKDRNPLDYLANDFGGDLNGFFGFDFGFGRPESDTYQAGQRLYASTEAQILTTFLPGGVLGRIGRGTRAATRATKGARHALDIDDAQFGHKIAQHARDFGLDPSNATHRAQLRTLIEDIGTNPQRVAEGTFRGLGPGGTRGPASFRVKGSDVVVATPEGRFVTILKGGINNPSVRRALGE